MPEVRRQVGVLIESSGWFMQMILKGVAEYQLRSSNWHVFLSDPSGGNLAAFLERWRGDGLIYAARDQRSVDLLHQTGIPAVNVAHRLAVLPPASVVCDEQAAGRLAADHLIERQFQYLAFSGLSGVEFSDQRGQGFLDRSRQANCVAQMQPRTRDLVRMDYSQRLDELARWLQGLAKPVGILAYNDGRAQQLVTAAELAGLRVPDQVAIIGIGNDEPLCEVSNPAISSVDMNLRQRGRAAAAMLDRMMKRDNEQDEAILQIAPVGVVARLSTDTVAVDDPDVAQAERWIRLNAAEGVNAEDVADHLHCSLRSLERRYRKHLGRGIGASLGRARLRHAQMLLRETDMTILEIALRSGFASSSSFATVFRRNFDCSPRDFRRRADDEQVDPSRKAV